MKKYGVIYADPPWQFKSYSGKVSGRSVENHYPTMSLDDIKKLPIDNIAHEDCALFLWVTFPRLADGLEVLKAWGFEYKTTAFVWVKQNRKSDSLFLGMGYWTRSNAEICLLGTKGRPRRVNSGVRQVVISHVEEHSRKPSEVHERITRLMGDVPKIELFARRKTEGFDIWGNEVESDIEMEDYKCS
jgi:N6-adenosine-specific RNA methylase IME4